MQNANGVLLLSKAYMSYRTGKVLSFIYDERKRSGCTLKKMKNEIQATCHGRQLSL